MSAALRYRVADNQAQLTLGGNALIVDPAGPLVEYADYARLKEKSACQTEALNAFDNKLRQAEAEVARLNAKIEELNQRWPNYHVDALIKSETQVERLRKAGDNMVRLWSSGTGTDLENFTEALWLWTTAKQTKPTE